MPKHPRSWPVVWFTFAACAFAVSALAAIIGALT